MINTKTQESRRPEFRTPVGQAISWPGEDGLLRSGISTIVSNGVLQSNREAAYPGRLLGRGPPWWIPREMIRKLEAGGWGRLTKGGYNIADPVHRGFSSDMIRRILVPLAFAMFSCAASCQRIVDGWYVARGPDGTDIYTTS